MLTVKRTSKILGGSAALGLLLFVIAGLVSAEGPDDISTAVSITAQAIQSGELSKNYEITGENLIAILEKVADFSNPQAALVFNRWTGQLFVRHTPAAHEQIAAILGAIRKSVNRQVEIETRIMTVKGTDFTQKGLDDFGLDFLTTKGKANRFGTDSAFADGSSDTNITFQDLVDDAGANTGGQLSLVTFSKRLNTTTLIDLLDKHTELNTLSAPRLTVFNNQRAHVKVSRSDYFVKELKVTSDVNADSVATEMTVTSADSGTVLDVTPTINKDGTVTLELHPQFVTVDLTKTQTINVAGTAILPAASQPFVRLPLFTNQSIDTTVTVEDGGVIMLGGFIDEKEDITWQRVPGIWRIPLIGKLFQNKKAQRVKTHLLIFIRAKTILPRALD